jgi:hypothetical protein
VDAQQQAANKTLSKSALVGFILSLVALCFPPLAIVGLILGIVGLVATGKNPSLSGRGLAIATVIIAPLVLVFVGGIYAAIAIPNFMKYQSRSMTMEARTNLRMISTGVQSKLAETEKLPPSLPRTPAEVPCGKHPQPWPADANPGWRDIGFAPEFPVRYSYEYIAGPDGHSFTIRAFGDLDCDGKTSKFELNSGSAEIQTENELD